MSRERLLVVTTRSKLRGLRFLPAMLNATLSIRQQLERAEGVVRWASIIAGPTEFWTVSAWDSRHRMQEFMRSDAHGRWMWRFSSWLSSFWLMRWRGGAREVGDWNGLEAVSPDRSTRARDRVQPPGSVLASMRDNIPDLYEALGPSGAPEFDRSGDTRRARRYVAGAGAVIVRLEVPTYRLPGALLELRGVRRELDQDGLVGCAVGFGRRNEAYLLAVWRDRRRARAFLDGEWVAEAARRFGPRLWAADWHPESEFGHWDGRRLRRERTPGMDAGSVSDGRR